MEKLEGPFFSFSGKITDQQLAYFAKNGFIGFKNFVSRETVQLFLGEIKRIEKEWIEDRVEKINGVPIKFGKDEIGNKTVQRFCFTNQYSKPLQDFVRDTRMLAFLELLKPYEGRIAETEKDGLVVNNYVHTPNSSFSQMGWHTDSPRDLFLGQKIMPMLNVGLHLDDCPREKGGLRIIPGTHKQGMLKLLFRKKYFIDNNPDPKEVGFDISAGDLTIHDGRLWHRVQQSPYYGEASRRRVMYVPVITGTYKPKNKNSRTPLYHRLGSFQN